MLPTGGIGTMQKALLAATHMVLVASPRAAESENVSGEVEWARDNGITVIPVICEPFKLPPQWHTIQYCQATTDAEYDRALLQLVSQLPRRET